jgi:hypothetical protein
MTDYGRWKGSPRGGFGSDTGFWVGIGERSTDIKLQFGSDDNIQLPLTVIRALLGTHDVHVMNRFEYSELVMWKTVAEEQMLRDGREIVRLRVALQNVEHELARLKDTSS